MDATSSARLRPYAGGSSSPRDPLGRKSSTNKSAQTTTKGSAQFFRVRAARSGGGPNGPARRPGGSTNRKSTAHSSSGAPPRAAKTSPDSAHSCWARQQFAASGECNEPRRVAVRRVGWRRTARLCESQEHSPFTALSFGFGLRAPRVGRRPSAQARRFYEPQKHSPFNRPNRRGAFSPAASGERILRLRRPAKDAVHPLRIRGLRADR